MHELASHYLCSYSFLQCEIFASNQNAFNFENLSAISSQQNQELYQRISTRTYDVTITQHNTTKGREEVYERQEIK